MKSLVSILWACVLTAPSAQAGGGDAPPADQADQGKAKLAGGDVLMSVERRTGSIEWLRAGPGRDVMSRWPLAGYVEVVDLRARRTYNPHKCDAVIAGWQVTEADGQKTLTFTQQYQGAPFVIAHVLRATPAGVRWDAALRLLDGQKECRSVQVCWVLPAPLWWRFWVPRETRSARVDGVTSARYVYGHAGFSPYNTIIPLAGLWGRRGGLACWSPPDVTKTQIIFEIDNRDLPDTPRGMLRKPEDRPRLRVAHHLVGLRPGKALKLAVCLAGVRPSWRAVLGQYVGTYPELFEPVPATRKVEGMYAITGLGGINEETVRGMVEAGVTFVELHGSFQEYSVYLTEEILARPDMEFKCKPHPSNVISLNHNRRWIKKFKKAGIAPFIYYYNNHAMPETIAKRWAGATFKDERGRTILKWYTEPAVWGPPHSPFGRHMIAQMDLMLKAYPGLPGFFVDNFGIEMISSAHDDGVTMLHDRPAYDMNRNHQGIGPIVFARAHRAGRLIMINKLATIESARGADMVLAEGMSLHSIRQHAFACVYRPLFPLGMAFRRNEPNRVERCLQQLLVVGGTPELGFFRADPETMKAYRPLTDAMIGKRWVLDHPDPLTVPPGYEGQIFRIDPNAPHPGDVVVALVDTARSFRQKRLTEGLTVAVRLPESGKLASAAWMTVEDSRGKPLPCKMARSGEELTITLPPAGAAGILRLTRP